MKPFCGHGRLWRPEMMPFWFELNGTLVLELQTHRCLLTPASLFLPLGSSFAEKKTSVCTEYYFKYRSLGSDFSRCNQCCGSGSALTWLSWIRILVGNLCPDPGARKIDQDCRSFEKGMFWFLSVSVNSKKVLIFIGTGTVGHKEEAAARRSSLLWSSLSCL
jgi:hypothetical protein